MGVCLSGFACIYANKVLSLSLCTGTAKVWDPCSAEHVRKLLSQSVSCQHLSIQTVEIDVVASLTIQHTDDCRCVNCSRAVLPGIVSRIVQRCNQPTCCAAKWRQAKTVQGLELRTALLPPLCARLRRARR